MKYSTKEGNGGSQRENYKTQKAPPQNFIDRKQLLVERRFFFHELSIMLEQHFGNAAS